jgi:predicted O-methyltransferase YrrM
LPDDGRIVTLELNPKYAEVAGQNIAAAGFAEPVELRVGPALDAMRALVAERAGPFDMIFIDADKETTADYFAVALELSRPGGVILTDNVVRDGAVADSDTDDPRALGMRRFHERLAEERATGRVSATTIQTVGLKGYDGFTLALVEAP